MKFLNIKLRRDIRKNWRQFFSVFLMALLSVLIFMGLQGVYSGLGSSVSKFIHSSNLPDSWVYSTTGFTDNQIKDIQAIKGVSDTSERTELNVSVPSSKTYLTLDSQAQNDFTSVHLDNGAAFEANNVGGVWLNKEYVASHHLKVGAPISVQINNQSVQLKLLGSIQSAERMYYTGTTDFIAPNYANYGYGLISNKTLALKFGYQGAPNVLVLKNSPTKIQPQIISILGNSYAGYYDRTTLSSVESATSRPQQIGNLSLLFSFIFILLAILAMYTTIRRLVQNQTKDIATLKALGFSNRSLGLHYASFGFAVGTAGALVGAALSPLVSLVILLATLDNISLPSWSISYDWTSLFVVLLVIAVSVLSAYLASRSARQGMPAAFLRGDTVKKAHHSFLERFSFWPKIKYAHRWAIRDTSSHKTRLFMGIIGVTGGMMLMFAGLGMPNSLNHLIDKTYTTDYTYNQRITTASYPLLKSENLQQWLQVSEGYYPKNEGYSRLFIVLGSGNEVHLKTENGQPIQDNGIYVSHGFAQSATIKVGDELPVRITGSDKTYTFKVAGILTSETNQGGYVTQKTFEQAGGIFYPQTLLASKGTTLPDAAVVSTATLQEQKNNAAVFVASYNGIFDLIILLAVVLVIVVLYNLGSLSFVERTRDYATLRVLGIQAKELRRITMTENVVTTFVGWVLGLPLGLWFLGAYTATMTTNQLEYTPYISFGNMILASVIVWIASLSTSFLIGRRIRNLDMIASLKEID